METERAGVSADLVAPLDRFDSALLRALAERLQRLDLMVKQQKAVIASYEQLGFVPDHSLDMLCHQLRLVEVVHWHRAVLMWTSRDRSIDVTEIQPLSLDNAPNFVLQDICVELEKRLAAPGAAANDVVADSVKAIFTRPRATPG